MKKTCLFALLMMILSGCASRMEPYQYESFSSTAGQIEKCFQAGYMEPKLYAQALESFSYLVNTWAYDRKKMESSMMQGYAKAYASHQNCQNAKALAYNLISNAGSHREQKRYNQEAINNTLNQINQNKPIYCNTIGTMTLCN